MVGPQYTGGTGGALLCCPPALLSWANHWLSLGLSFLIWEMKGLDQVNPKSTVSGNILGYLNSLHPNFAAVGGGDSTQQRSVQFPSFTDLLFHGSGYRTVPNGCVYLVHNGDHSCSPSLSS